MTFLDLDKYGRKKHRYICVSWRLCLLYSLEDYRVFKILVFFFVVKYEPTLNQLLVDA